MAKEPEDNHGPSNPDGEMPPEKSPSPENSSSTPEEQGGQEELSFEEESQWKGPSADFPEANFPRTGEAKKRDFDEPVSGADHGEESEEEVRDGCGEPPGGDA